MTQDRYVADYIEKLKTVSPQQPEKWYEAQARLSWLRHLKRTFKQGDIVWDKEYKKYGVIIDTYLDTEHENCGEMRLDSDGNRPIDQLAVLGAKDDKGTKKKLANCLYSWRHLRQSFPEHDYKPLNY